MRAIVLLCVLVSACASHGVRCDGRLRPINPPSTNTDAAGASGAGAVAGGAGEAGGAGIGGPGSPGGEP